MSEETIVARGVLRRNPGRLRGDWWLDLGGNGIEFEGLLPAKWEGVAVTLTRRRQSVTIQVDARQPDLALDEEGRDV